MTRKLKCIEVDVEDVFEALDLEGVNHGLIGKLRAELSKKKTDTLQIYPEHVVKAIYTEVNEL